MAHDLLANKKIGSDRLMIAKRKRPWTLPLSWRTSKRLLVLPRAGATTIETIKIAVAVLLARVIAIIGLPPIIEPIIEDTKAATMQQETMEDTITRETIIRPMVVSPIRNANDENWMAHTAVQSGTTSNALSIHCQSIDHLQKFNRAPIFVCSPLPSMIYP